MALIAEKKKKEWELYGKGRRGRLVSGGVNGLGDKWVEREGIKEKRAYRVEADVMATRR